MLQVTLRDVVESDVAAFYEHQCEPDACNMVGLEPRPRNGFVSHWQSLLTNERVQKKTILVSSDDKVCCQGEIAGNVVCYPQDGMRLVGYWLGKRFWGHGIASQAVGLFVGFNDLPLHAFVRSTNVRSVRVLENCGFVLCKSTQTDEELLYQLC